MKINRLSYTIFGSVLLLGSLTACEDYLDTTPDTRVEINTPEQVRLLLVDAYSNANYGTMLEMSSDNIIDNNSPDENGMRYNLDYRNVNDLRAFCFEEANSELDDDSPSYIWERCYHSIAVCNEALKAIEKLEAAGRGDEVSAQKGEALVSRAYHHFILANVFCLPYRGPELSKQILGIPYMTEPETKVLVHYERLPLNEVYQRIEDDLLAGLPLIDDSSYDVPKYHFNTKAANAFAARFYLFSRRYKEAEAYASVALGGTIDKNLNIIAEGSPELRKYWRTAYTNADAKVAAYCTADDAANLMLIATNSTYNRSRGGRFSINRDAKAATYYGHGPAWNTDYTHYYCHPCYSGNMYIRASQEYGIFFTKCLEFFEYSDKVARIGYCHIIRCEFTAEEALLTRAEARIWLGKEQEAINDLQTWELNRENNPVSGVQYRPVNRSTIDAFYGDHEWIDSRDQNKGDVGYVIKNGIVKPLNIDLVHPSEEYTYKPSMENLLQCVLHFRRIETCEDGMRWFDIRRYGIEITHKFGADGSVTLKWDDSRRCLQIPAEVMASGLKPNDRFPADGSGDQTMVKAEYLRVK